MVKTTDVVEAGRVRVGVAWVIGSRVRQFSGDELLSSRLVLLLFRGKSHAPTSAKARTPALIHYAQTDPACLRPPVALRSLRQAGTRARVVWIVGASPAR